MLRLINLNDWKDSLLDWRNWQKNVVILFSEHYSRLLNVHLAACPFNWRVLLIKQATVANFTVDEHYTSKLNRTSTLIWPKEIVALLSAIKILLSITAFWLLFIKRLLSIHPQNVCSNIWRSLIFVLASPLIAQLSFAVDLTFSTFMLEK